MEKEKIITQFSEALYQERGVVFVGSGISRASGMSTWAELLRESAKKDLSIELDDKHDLTEIAQYIVNHNVGNKWKLLKEIERSYLKISQTNKYHELLVRMNLKTIWTTNYDTLLEKAFKQNIVVSKKDIDLLPTYQSNKNIIELIKMHGCVTEITPASIVITKEDYDDYETNYPLTIQKLRSELIHKSFLFIGYSYRDPNVKIIVNQVRQLCKQKMPEHYLILEEPEHSEDKVLQELWIKDLVRYGIYTYSYKNENHIELEDILEKISLKSKGNTIYITGGHRHNENSDGEINHFLRDLAEKIVDIEDIIVINGQSKGVGKIFTNHFLDFGIEKQKNIQNRLKMFPNPYAVQRLDDSDKIKEDFISFRKELFSHTQIMLVFDGGKGTLWEYEIAKKMGTIIIPINYSEKRIEDSEFEAILKDKDVLDILKKYDAEYVSKLEDTDEKINIKDVEECIKKILNIK